MRTATINTMDGSKSRRQSSSSTVHQADSGLAPPRMPRLHHEQQQQAGRAGGDGDQQHAAARRSHHQKKKERAGSPVLQPRSYSNKNAIGSNGRVSFKTGGGPELIPDSRVQTSSIDDENYGTRTKLFTTDKKKTFVSHANCQANKKHGSPYSSSSSIGMTAIVAASQTARESSTSGLAEEKEPRFFNEQPPMPPTINYDSAHENQTMMIDVINDSIHEQQEGSSAREFESVEMPSQASRDQLETQTVVATPVIMEESVAEEGGNKPIAVAMEAKPWYHRKKLVAGLVLVILGIGGGVAGVVYAMTNNKEDGTSTSSTEEEPSLPFRPPPTLLPTPEPEFFQLEQLGESIVLQDIPENIKDRQFGHALALSGDGHRFAAVSPLEVSVYVYDQNATATTSRQQWELTAILKGSEMVHHVAISASGGVLAMGFPGNDEVSANAGKVLVYEETSLGQWQQLGNPIYGEDSGDCLGGGCVEIGDADYCYGSNFGCFANYFSSLALSENGRVIAVGSGEGNYAKVLLLDKVTSTWKIMGNKVLRGSGGFGSTLDLSGDGRRVIVAAPFGDAIPGGTTQQGQVLVYEFSQATDSWQKLGQDFNGISEYVIMGSSIGMSSDGNFVLAGAAAFTSVDGILEEDSLGFARVYRYSNDQWEQVGNTLNFLPSIFEDTDTADFNQDKFIGLVRLSGNGKRLAISYPLDPNVDVRLYEIRDMQWVQFVAPVAGEFPKFPLDEFLGLGTGEIALSEDGSVLAVASPLSDKNGQDNGEVRIFQVTSESAE